MPVTDEGTENLERYFECSLLPAELFVKRKTILHTDILYKKVISNNGNKFTML